MENHSKRPEGQYATCGAYVIFVSDHGVCTVSRNGTPVIQQLQLYNALTDQPFSFAPYPAPNRTHSDPLIGSGNRFHRFHNVLTLAFHADTLPDVTLSCSVSDQEVFFSLEASEDLPLVWKGLVYWGEDMETETFAVNLEQETPVLRAAIGPAADRFSHALLNRQTGQILNFGTEFPVRLAYSYSDGCYRLQSRGKQFVCSVMEDHYQRQYGVRYRPIRKNSPIHGAPAGFCTYYAWNFRFDEKDFMEAVDAQREKLLPFGANCVLLDLEWVREDICQNRNFPGDHFHPDIRRFPSGMKAVAEGIKKAGFVPQLWYGVTNEAHITKEMEEHPDIVLTDEDLEYWPGCRFLDVTHPYVKETYLPRFFAQLKEWGFDALKWDLLTETETILETYHDRLYDPSKSATEIMRELLELMRKEMGEDVFVCQCAAQRKQQIRIGADIFNSMRIGADLWNWEHFRENMLYKLCTHYPLHNVMLYCDPDNLILGEDRLKIEFNKDETITLEEAFSRVVPVTLLGQAFMIGEDLRTLPEDRMELLRRGLPVADVHPAKLGFTKQEPVMLTVVQIQKPFGTWTVFSVVNTTDETVTKEISLQQELGLEPADYLIYDYCSELLYGSSDTYSVMVEPRNTELCTVHKKQDVPQVVSSSRHFLQGAVELENAAWSSGDNTLTVHCKTVAEYPYHITVFVPEDYIPNTQSLQLIEHRADLGGSVYRLSIPGEKAGLFCTTLPFTKK